MRVTTFDKIQINIKAAALDWQFDIRLDHALKAKLIEEPVSCVPFCLYSVIFSLPRRSYFHHWCHYVRCIEPRYCQCMGICQAKAVHSFVEDVQCCFISFNFFFFSVLIMRLCRVKWTVLLWNFKICMLKTMEKTLTVFFDVIWG